MEVGTKQRLTLLDVAVTRLIQIRRRRRKRVIQVSKSAIWKLKIWKQNCFMKQILNIKKNINIIIIWLAILASGSPEFWTFSIQSLTPESTAHPAPATGDTWRSWYITECMEELKGRLYLWDRTTINEKKTLVANIL